MIKNISNLGITIQKKQQKQIHGGMLSPVTCTEIMAECDACHPNNYNHFLECMTDLGCASGNEFPSR